MCRNAIKIPQSQKLTEDVRKHKKLNNYKQLDFYLLFFVLLAHQDTHMSSALVTTATARHAHLLELRPRHAALSAARSSRHRRQTESLHALSQRVHSYQSGKRDFDLIQFSQN